LLPAPRADAAAAITTRRAIVDAKDVTRQTMSLIREPRLRAGAAGDAAVAATRAAMFSPPIERCCQMLRCRGCHFRSVLRQRQRRCYADADATPRAAILYAPMLTRSAASACY